MRDTDNAENGGGHIEDEGSLFGAIDIDDIPDAVVIADADTSRIVRTNAAAVELFQCVPGDLVGRLQTELHPEAKVTDAYVEAFQRGLKNQRVNRLQSGDPLFIKTVNGEHVPVEINVQMLTADGDDYLMGVFREASEQLARERTLKKTAGRLEALLNTLPTPVALLDTDGTVERWNQAAEDVLGYAADQIVGETYSLFTDSEEFSTLWARVINGETITEYQTTLRAADGSRVSAEIDVCPVVIDGTVSRVLGTAVDISDQKQREQQLDVLYRLIRHNIRNELNVIYGWTESLEAGECDDEEAIAMVKSSSKRLSKLSGQIVDIPRTVTPDKGVTPQAVDTLIESLSEQLRTDEGVTRLNLSTGSAEGKVPTMGVQATAKLFDNLYATTDSAAVDLMCDSLSSHTRVSLNSTAPLFSIGERTLIREKTETPLRHASGVETAWSYLTIRSVGGAVTLEDGSGEAPATYLRVELPRADV